MFCGAKEAGGVYRPRHPQQSPFYKLVERFYPEFEAVYEERYQERYGFWRPIIGTVVRKFLECGDLKHGFARVRCPKCREELFVPYSCPGAMFLPELPRETGAGKGGLGGRARLRRGAASAICVHDSQAPADLLPLRAAAPGRPVPGGRPYGDHGLIQYFLRCPFSQARMIEVTEAGKVIYKTEHNAVGRFPEPGDEELLAGPSRNFQIFDPLDFLAEVTQHIPDPGEHLVRYYGWYSNKTRGQRAQRQPTADGTGIPARSPSAREARKGWAALIKQVYEADPIRCRRCGSVMKIIAFIEPHQTEVIEKILRHCGLWEEGPARAPPSAKISVTG